MMTNERDFSATAIGMRSFALKQLDGDRLLAFGKKAETIKTISDQLRSGFGEKAPQVSIITNNDLAADARSLLNATGLTITTFDPEKAKRRAHLGKLLVKGSSPSGVSNSDMLNALEKEPEETNPNIKTLVFASPSLAGNTEILIQQITTMQTLYDEFESKVPGRLTMVGPLIDGDAHDSNLVQRIIAGQEHISISNLNKVFPNNALSLVRAGIKFSGVTDNGLSGTIDTGGKSELIGGGEDFFYGFGQMLAGKDCVLIIDPIMPGERQEKRETVKTASKLDRRSEVYRLYAQRLIIKSARVSPAFNKELSRTIVRVATGDIDINSISSAMVGLLKNGHLKMNLNLKQSRKFFETTVLNIIDKHLFFARMKDGKPEVVLTARQVSGGIQSPI